MLTKEKSKLIEDAMDMLMAENNGSLLIIPNMPKIAKLAKVSYGDVQEHFEKMLFDKGGE